MKLIKTLVYTEKKKTIFLFFYTQMSQSASEFQIITRRYRVKKQDEG